VRIDPARPGCYQVCVTRDRAKQGPADRFLELWRQLRDDELGVAYVLYGSRDERDLNQVQFLLDRTVAILRERFSEDPSAKFNLDVFHGGQAGVEQALNIARTVPMFGKRRLTMLLDLPEPDDADADRIVRYLSDPAPHTTLGLVFASGKLPRKVHNACRPLGCLYKAERLRERDLPTWIGRCLRHYGLAAAPGVARAVAEYTGTNLQAIEDAVEKLAIYTAGSRRVEVEDVEECVLSVRQSEIFDLLDAMGARNPGRALSILGRLAGQRTDSLFINAMLSKQIRNMIRIRARPGRLPGREEVASELGVHPYFAGKLLEQVRNFSMTDLERALAASAEFNVRVKRSRVPSDRLMEAMVLAIIRGQEA
jgi:DNA polymerase-3 subunit delta